MVSLILGIVGLLTCGIPGIAGFICILVARHSGAKGNLASASLIINIIATLIGIFVFIVVMIGVVRGYMDAAESAQHGLR